MDARWSISNDDEQPRQPGSIRVSIISVWSVPAIDRASPAVTIHLSVIRTGAGAIRAQLSSPRATVNGLLAWQITPNRLPFPHSTHRTAGQSLQSTVAPPIPRRNHCQAAGFDSLAISLSA